MITSIRDRALLAGTFTNLGNSMTTEMAGASGVDWFLLDVKHGSGDQDGRKHQIQAVSATPTASVVRI